MAATRAKGGSSACNSRLPWSRGFASVVLAGIAQFGNLGDITEEFALSIANGEGLEADTSCNR